MNKKTIKILVNYGFAAILLWVVAYVYTLFGRGVHSNAMTYMFLFPLIGAFIGVILTRIKSNSIWSYSFLHMGVVTLSIGSFLKGVLDIAGTGSSYISLFYVLGGIFIVSAIINATTMYNKISLKNIK